MLSLNLNFEINHPESSSLSWENTGQYIGSSYILVTSLLIIKIHWSMKHKIQPHSLYFLHSYGNWRSSYM